MLIRCCCSHSRRFCWSIADAAAGVVAVSVAADAVVAGTAHASAKRCNAGEAAVAVVAVRSSSESSETSVGEATSSSTFNKGWGRVALDAAEPINGFAVHCPFPSNLIPPFIM